MFLQKTSRQIGITKRQARFYGISYETYCSFKNRGLKCCQVCKTWRPISIFAKDRSRHDGYHTKCRLCTKVKERKQIVFSTETIERLRKRNKKNKWMAGKTHSAKTRKALREYMLENKPFVGKKNPHWKGGVTEKNHALRNSDQYKQWRLQVFERDEYTCQDCGDNKGGNLIGHHMKPWAKYKSLRFIVSNGLTLCEKCHIAHHKSA